MKGLLILNFIIPCVMLFAAWFLKRKQRLYPGPPSRNQEKWKVDFSGYNTPRSRKSKEHWDYAQKIAPEWFFYYGKWGAVIAGIWTLYGLHGSGHEDASVINSMIWGFAYLFRAFYVVEKKLKEQFGE